MKSRSARVYETVRRRPWPDRIRSASPTVGIVIVNYNTLDLISMLLFTLYRVLPVGSFRRLIVVDNGSTDGSLDFLIAAQQAGLLELEINRWPATHGPGLNRGVNRLAIRGDVDLVWVLDSDVLVLRSDALSAAINFLETSGAALIGQKKLDHWYAHVSSNLFDPVKVWRRGISPFWPDGEPGARMQKHLLDSGNRVEEFEFYREEYLLHIGGGTLDRVAAAQEKKSGYLAWSEQAETGHYHGNLNGPKIVAAVRASLLGNRGVIDGNRVVELCQQSERLSNVTVDSGFKPEP